MPAKGRKKSKRACCKKGFGTSGKRRQNKKVAYRAFVYYLSLPVPPKEELELRSSSNKSPPPEREAEEHTLGTNHP